MKVALASSFGRLVVAVLVVAASVLVPAVVVADGDPVQPTPKPAGYPDLSAPAEVVVSAVWAGYLMLDWTAF